MAHVFKIIGWLWLLGLIPAFIDIMAIRKLNNSTSFVAASATVFGVLGMLIARPHAQHHPLVAIVFVAVSMLLAIPATMPRLVRRKIWGIEREAYVVSHGKLVLDAQQAKARFKAAIPAILWPNGWVLMLMLIGKGGHMLVYDAPNPFNRVQKPYPDNDHTLASCFDKPTYGRTDDNPHNDPTERQHDPAHSFEFDNIWHEWD